VDDTAPAASLYLRINLLGGAAFVGYAILTLLSYLQAPALWHAEDATQILAFFDDLANSFPILALYRSFPSSEAVIATYWAPLALPSLAALLLVLLLSSRKVAADERALRLVLKWSWAFAGICALAFPVFTQDMWLSAVWGRMIASGINPYYNLFTTEMLAGLPLDHFPMVMSYGPLWGMLAAVAVIPTGGSVLAIAVLSKALLAAAWLGSLALIVRIADTRPLRHRCLTASVFGWTPASVSQTIAEGHNDIVLVLLALLWLFLLLRSHGAAPVALVASALCKYATLPLLLVDALWVLRRDRIAWSAFFLRYIAPTLVALATLAVFYRSTAFFDGLKIVSDWYFLRPSDAFISLEALTGLPMLAPKLAIVVFFPALAAYWLVVAFWSPTTDSLLKATAAVMAAVLFSCISHVWPWYIVWVLALAAILPGWWLSRFVFGLAILMPFALAAWWIEPVQQSVEFAALIVYAGAGVWCGLTRQRDDMPGLEKSSMPQKIHAPWPSSDSR
jgi:alpha-1,6-mannosyltransferase